MTELGRWLVLAGLALAATGALIWLFGGILPFGRLPGDFRFGRGPVRVMFPLATSLLVSLVLTVVLNIVLRWLNR